MHFSPANGAVYGVYHSVYDSFEWMETEGDPTFQYHVAMAQVWGLMALRLAGDADDAVPAPLPFNSTLQADAIGGYILEAKALLNATTEPLLSFVSLDAAAADFRDAATTAMRAVDALATRTPSPARDAAVALVNERLALVERRFLSAAEGIGLPGRKWFRHCLQAPGLYTGYAPQTLPGVVHAIKNAAWGEAQEQADECARRIEAAAAYLFATAQPRTNLRHSTLRQLSTLATTVRPNIRPKSCCHDRRAYC